MERRMNGTRLVARRGRLTPAQRRQKTGVPHRLRRRAVGQRGQPLRLPAHLRPFQSAAPASGHGFGLRNPQRLLTQVVFGGTGIALIQNPHWIFHVFGPVPVVSGSKCRSRRTSKCIRKGISGANASTISCRLGRSIAAATFSRSGRSLGRPDRFSIRCNCCRPPISCSQWTPCPPCRPSPPAHSLSVARTCSPTRGPRSMFLALTGILKLFHHLPRGPVAVLRFVRAKMRLAGF